MLTQLTIFCTMYISETQFYVKCREEIIEYKYINIYCFLTTKSNNTGLTYESRLYIQIRYDGLCFCTWLCMITKIYKPKPSVSNESLWYLNIPDNQEKKVIGFIFYISLYSVYKITVSSFVLERPCLLWVDLLHFSFNHTWPIFHEGLIASDT